MIEYVISTVHSMLCFEMVRATVKRRGCNSFCFLVVIFSGVKLLLFALVLLFVNEVRDHFK